MWRHVARWQAVPKQLPAIGKARSPTVLSRVRRITNSEVDDDRRRRRRLKSATRWEITLSETAEASINNYCQLVIDALRHRRSYTFRFSFCNQTRAQFGYLRRVTLVCRCLHPFCGWRYLATSRESKTHFGLPWVRPGTIAVNVTCMEREFYVVKRIAAYTHLSSTVYELQRDIGRKL